MVGWHHQLNGHEFEQAQGDGERQGSLVYYSPWNHRVGYDWAIEQQQNSEIIWLKNLPFQWVKSDFMKMGFVYVWKVQIPAPSFTTNVLNHNVSLWDFGLCVSVGMCMSVWSSIHQRSNVPFLNILKLTLQKNSSHRTVTTFCRNKEINHLEHLNKTHSNTDNLL